MVKKRAAALIRAFAFLAFLFLTAVPSHGFDLGARGYYWRPLFSGEFQADEGKIIGTAVDTQDDLGMDDESFPTLELFFGLGKHHLSCSYTNGDYSGQNNIERDLVFKGQTYPFATLVQSDLKLQMLDLEYQYDFLRRENVLADFSLGFVAKAKYLDGEARLQAQSFGYDDKERFKVPVPMVGLDIHVGLLDNMIQARVKGAGVTYSGSTFYDAQADIAFTPVSVVAIHGGYRIMKLKIDDFSGVSTDIAFDGPYAGLTISF